MSETQVHRLSGGCYSFGNSALTVFRDESQWLCGYLFDEDDSPEGVWYERNLDLFDIRFDTFRQARDYILALLDQDPVPQDELLPARCLRRVTDSTGEYYEVRVGKARYTARRSADRTWVLSNITRHRLPHVAEFESLWHLRLNLGDFKPAQIGGV